MRHLPRITGRAAGVVLALFTSTNAGAADALRPTMVELFTSQGCSSCPPANDNLALSFGVTYWNQLGWKDTFSEPVFTRRQWEYARGLATDGRIMVAAGAA